MANIEEIKARWVGEPGNKADLEQLTHDLSWLIAEVERLSELCAIAARAWEGTTSLEQRKHILRELKEAGCAS